MTSAIDAVRPAAFGPNAEAAAAAEFSRLHETSRSICSRWWALGLVALTVLQTRADA